jgi:NAD-dependent SIR2 family protein deacetylase
MSKKYAKIRCPECREIVPFKKTLYQMQSCKCGQLKTDWVSYSEDTFRILGKYEEVKKEMKK